MKEPTISPAADWIGTQEAAQLAKVALPTIQKWLSTGQLDVQRQGRRWLVSRQSLQNQMARYGHQAVAGHMTLAEAAGHYGVSQNRLRQALEAGQLQPTRLGVAGYWRLYLNCSQLEEWLRKPAPPRKKIAPLPRYCPADGPQAYSLPQAAAAVARSEGLMKRAIARGELTRNRQGLIDREELNRWLEARFQQSGGTDAAETLSLRQASQLAGVSTPHLRRLIHQGKFSPLANPAGQPLLNRQEFEQWLKQRPPTTARPEQLTLKQVAGLVNIKLATVQKDVTRGLLKASRVTNGLKAHYVVSPTDLRSWILEREKKYAVATLRGEELSTRQACERFGCTYDILKQGLDLGKLPDCRRFGPNGSARVWGALDVEEYLRGRAEPHPYWTRSRVVEATGINSESVRRAMHSGAIQTRQQVIFGLGRILVAETASLLEWMRKGAPPYRKEAAHLSGWLRRAEASQVTGLGLPQIDQALARGELVSLDGDCIPRYSLDRWLENQGLLPTWQLDSASEWLTVAAAADRSGMARPTIQKWIATGQLRCRRAGRRWLVQRQSLERQMSLCGPQAVLNMETLDDAASRLKISRRELGRAVQGGDIPSQQFLQGRYWRTYLNPEDVSEWAAGVGKLEPTAWTAVRIADVTGLELCLIGEALDAGHPRWRRRHGRRVAEPLSLLTWLESTPPYRREVARLSRTVSTKRAGKLSGLGQTQAVKAVRAGRLAAIQVEADTGPRYYIPRKSLDEWLQSCGLPPSWQLEKPAGTG